MARRLCISVSLLDPLLHGKGDAEPEWSPPPMRLLQAFPAGARAKLRGSTWGEGLAAAFWGAGAPEMPLILAPQARPASACACLVPNKDGGEVLERQDRRSSEVAGPHRLLEGGAIHHVWSIAEVLRADVLCGEARHSMVSVGASTPRSGTAGFSATPRCPHSQGKGGVRGGRPEAVIGFGA